MRPIIYPYNMGSASARDLSRSLGTKRVLPNGRYRHLRNDLIINWGNSIHPSWWYQQRGRMVNKPGAVSIASNKRSTFINLSSHSVSTVGFVCNAISALQWLEEGHKVYARTLLSSCSGKGIVIMRTPEDMVMAPLYTLHFKHKYEYRVHVFNGKVIDIQVKRKRKGVSSNGEIRNLSNGWIYARENLSVPQNIIDTSIAAVAACGLDFGAVDIAYNEHYDCARVLEINTAPGLAGTTLANYIRAIKEAL